MNAWNLFWTLADLFREKLENNSPLMATITAKGAALAFQSAALWDW